MSQAHLNKQDPEGREKTAQPQADGIKWAQLRAPHSCESNNTTEPPPLHPRHCPTCAPLREQMPGHVALLGKC